MQASEILIVDDSPTVRMMVRDLLEAEGYCVREAENGAAAVQEVMDKRPDLVLMDIMMPEMDGFQACRQLRRDLDEYVPVLMLTAKSEAEDLARGLAIGADDYITKPFNNLELIARVRNLLRIRSLQHEVEARNHQLEGQNEQLEAQAAQLQAQAAQLQAQAAQLQAQSAELQTLNANLTRKKQELELANQRLELLAVTDGLTGAFNHRHFHERLHAEFARAVRHGQSLSCVMIDIDKFKTRCNDAHGHRAGDRVLKRLVEILKDSVRTEDLVARYGGEEFVLLLPSTSAARAAQLAERIRERVAGTEIAVGRDQWLSVTVSLGVADWEPGRRSVDAEGLLHAADEALYVAKAEGRNRVGVAPVAKTSVA